MKSDPFPGRLGRSDELLDRFEDHRELLVVFLLKRSDLASEIAIRVHEPAQLHECAHDGDVDSRSPDRSPVSQTDNAVYPAASPHAVLRIARKSSNDGLL